ncbi:hypothetical protein K491DRAFT_750485 [Lophiostoma macrostomum CBS 122681]|uniref:Lytic polysaccharide monooxygenase n=1 Tax=Lophiostoma macrostomum CBS 122681 TaxID=1314788 RepID=A0A6A6T5M1_9PLEO|nr:hypothetical protein K491DRAFT_750485 [Lophiostoma macrostomum CBS 122681]
MATKLLTFASLLAIDIGAPAPANLEPRLDRGICMFTATLTQDCDISRGGLITRVKIPVITGNDAKPIAVPGGPFIVDSTPYVIGLPGINGGHKLYVTWDPNFGEGEHHGQVRWNYEGCPWWSQERGSNACGSCQWTDWTKPQPVCPAAEATSIDTRISTMTCEFKCGDAAKDGIQADVLEDGGRPTTIRSGRPHFTRPTQGPTEVEVDNHKPTSIRSGRPHPTLPTQGPTEAGVDSHKPTMTWSGRPHPTRPTQNPTVTV